MLFYYNQGEDIFFGINYLQYKTEFRECFV